MADAHAALMYHAVSVGAEQYANADAHYSVTRAQFARHLDAIDSLGLRAISIAAVRANSAAEGASQSGVVLTFDDGHATNRWAAEVLASRGFTADFFINPSTIGQADFLTWADVRAMADQGMSIQSHGYAHRYLDELSPAEVHGELVDSKRAIEDKLGVPVTIFGPPGGRLAPNLAATAESVGYEALCTSRAGLWQPRLGSWHIPRMPVLNATSDGRFVRWIAQDAREFALQRGRDLILMSAKRVLGNGGYERLRTFLLPSHSA